MIPFVPLPYQFLAKFILIFATACLGCFSGWWVTSDHYLAEINALKVANSNTVNSELLRQQKLAQDRAELTRLAEEQHAKDQLVINRLGNELSRMRVHLPSVDCNSVSGTGQGITDSNRTSGAFYQRVDAAFAELQSGVGQLIQRCDQLNVEAIAANAKLGQNSDNIK